MIENPMRSDILSVKVRNYDTKTENYYLDGKLIFNDLLKVKKDNALIKTLSEDAKRICEKIKAIGESDYLIYKDRGERYSSSLTLLLKKISLKRLGVPLDVNICRKIYASNGFSGCETVNEILLTADSISKDLNNSIPTLANYYVNIPTVSDPVIEIELNGNKIKGKVSYIKLLM